MDFATNTEHTNEELDITEQDNLLLIIKEVCTDSDSKLSMKLRGKVNKIIAETELKQHTSLHRLSTADESASTVLGFMTQSSTELTFDEQVELNQAIINKIEMKIPACNLELENLKKTIENCKKFREDQIKELKDKESNLDTLQEQEGLKMELMMEWLNHRIHGSAQFTDNSSELFALKTKILNLKSQILHLQVLQNIFTETNQSMKAYSEIHKDLKDTLKETEERIKAYQSIIDSDLN